MEYGGNCSFVNIYLGNTITFDLSTFHSTIDHCKDASQWAKYYVLQHSPLGGQFEKVTPRFFAMLLLSSYCSLTVLIFLYMSTNMWLIFTRSFGITAKCYWEKKNQIWNLLQRAPDSPTFSHCNTQYPEGFVEILGTEKKAYSACIIRCQGDGCSNDLIWPSTVERNTQSFYRRHSASVWR